MAGILYLSTVIKASRFHFFSTEEFFFIPLSQKKKKVTETNCYFSLSGNLSLLGIPQRGKERIQLDKRREDNSGAEAGVECGGDLWNSWNISWRLSAGMEWELWRMLTNLRWCFSRKVQSSNSRRPSYSLLSRIILRYGDSRSGGLGWPGKRGRSGEKGCGGVEGGGGGGPGKGIRIGEGETGDNGAGAEARQDAAGQGGGRGNHWDPEGKSITGDRIQNCRFGVFIGKVLRWTKLNKGKIQNEKTFVVSRESAGGGLSGQRRRIGRTRVVLEGAAGANQAGKAPGGFRGCTAGGLRTHVSDQFIDLRENVCVQVSRYIRVNE
ncbi:hypothetical protein VP01_1236g2 [Puccinia sorghi]|uniref:Uncharacterized protein n=1 Tax=Puccinia sorghi TaxID=27349 RepID=A0A0L6VPQ1_9BASI|nr:hypothetical protein VP01_1236g2 [Puccinia sorghi]